MLRTLRIALLVSLLMVIATAIMVNAQADVTPKASDVLYAGDSQPSDLLDVYVPDSGSALYPVVVMFTTSSGLKSDLSDFGAPQAIVDQGYAAVTVGYRSAIPATYDDAFCALAWVYANAAQYNLDSSRIALYGVSWGGLAAATVAQTDDPTPYMTDCPNSLPADHAVRGVITNSGAFLTVPDEIAAMISGGLYPDMAKFPADTLQKTMTALKSITPDQWCCLFFPIDVHEAIYELPIFHVNNHEPPFLMVQGLADTTVPYQDPFNYAQALLEQGTSVQMVFDPASQHVVDLAVYQEQMAAFLKRIFG